MAKLERHDSQTNLRGLGCGGHADRPVGKLNKTCVDCGGKVKVAADQVVCEDCGGPLSSSYDD